FRHDADEHAAECGRLTPVVRVGGQLDAFAFAPFGERERPGTGRVPGKEITRPRIRFGRFRLDGFRVYDCGAGVGQGGQERRERLGQVEPYDGVGYGFDFSEGREYVARPGGNAEQPVERVFDRRGV